MRVPIFIGVVFCSLFFRSSLFLAPVSIRPCCGARSPWLQEWMHVSRFFFQFAPARIAHRVGWALSDRPSLAILALVARHNRSCQWPKRFAHKMIRRHERISPMFNHIRPSSCACTFLLAVCARGRKRPILFEHVGNNVNTNWKKKKKKPGEDQRDGERDGDGKKKKKNGSEQQSQCVNFAYV